MNLVIGFGPSLGLALWPRAKPINKEHFEEQCMDIYKEDFKKYLKEPFKKGLFLLQILIGLALGQSARPRFGPKPITKFTLRHHISHGGSCLHHISHGGSTTGTFPKVLGLVGE